MSTQQVPRTADSDRFRFRAGRVSLDLCSTILWRRLDPVEQLTGPTAVAGWLLQAGLCTSPAELSAQDVRRVHRLREACYRLLRAHLERRRLPRADVATVNECAASPDPVPRLNVTGSVSWQTEDPLAAALSLVARDLIDLLTGPLSGRIRECAAADCAFLFVDTSRPGNRRWCATNRCGNREHVRAHRRRRSATPAQEPTGGPSA